MKFSKLIKTAALATAVAFSANAMAEINPKFYVGAEGKVTKLGYHKDFKAALDNAGVSYKSNLPGVGLFAGANFNEFVGAEVGLDLYKKIKFTHDASGAESKLNFSNIYFDVNGYLPVSKEIKLIGSIGVGRAKISNEVVRNVEVSSTKVGARVGAGAQYNFNENFGARAMVRWQNVGGSDAALKDMTSVGLGVVYSF